MNIYKKLFKSLSIRHFIKQRRLINSKKVFDINLILIVKKYLFMKILIIFLIRVAMLKIISLEFYYINYAIV